MWEALSKEVSGWAVAAIVVIIVIGAQAAGRFVPIKFVREIVESHKQRADDAEKRADRWESAWYKLYAAQQLRTASETTAVSEVALTMATALEHLREVGDEDGVGSPPPPTDP